MRKHFILIFLVLSHIGNVFATAEPEEFVPVKHFQSILLKDSIEQAYKSEDINHIKGMIKKANRLFLDSKWKKFYGLAKKIGKEIPERKTLFSEYQLTVTNATEGKIFYDNDMPYNKGYINQNNGVLNEPVENILSSLSCKELKAYLANMHFNLFVEDILLFALEDVPDSTWLGAEYCTLDPYVGLSLRKKDFVECYKPLWADQFRESLKYQSTVPNMSVCHGFSDLDNDANPTSTNFLSYAYQLFKFCRGCGKNCGRQKSGDPILYLIEPRTRLYQYACSLDFQSVLESKSERRLINYPSVEFINALLPWAFITGPTFPTSRLTNPIVRQVKKKVKSAPKAIGPKQQLIQRVKEHSAEESVRLTKMMEERDANIAELEKKLHHQEELSKEDHRRLKELQTQIRILSEKSVKLVRAKDESREGELEARIKELELVRAAKEKANLELSVRCQSLESELEGKLIIQQSSKAQLAELEQKMQARHREMVVKLEDRIKLLEDDIATYVRLIENQKKEIHGLKTKPKTKAKSKPKVEQKPPVNMQKMLQEERAAREKLEAQLATKQSELDAHLAEAKAFLVERDVQLKTEMNTKEPPSENSEERASPFEPAYVADLLNRLTAAAMHIQHLSDWCTYLHQGWSSAESQVRSQTQLGQSRVLEIDGELFNFTPTHVDEILYNHGIQARQARKPQHVDSDSSDVSNRNH